MLYPPVFHLVAILYIQGVRTPPFDQNECIALSTPLFQIPGSSPARAPPPPSVCYVIECMSVICSVARWDDINQWCHNRGRSDSHHNVPHHHSDRYWPGSVRSRIEPLFISPPFCYAIGCTSVICSIVSTLQWCHNSRSSDSHLNVLYTGNGWFWHSWPLDAL